MTDRLADVEGVGPAHAATLASHGLTTTDDLLARGAYPAGRAALAETTGISPTLILEWVNHADLFRIHGVAGQYADLLEEAGVDTVVELAQRNPENLAGKLAEVNLAKNLTNRVPSVTEVAGWVAEAKGLPRAVFYQDAATQTAAQAPPAPLPAEASAAEPEPVADRSSPPVDSAAEPAPARPVMDAPKPMPPAATAPGPDDRSWLSRVLDRLRGR